MESVEWLFSERLISQANISARSSDPLRGVTICMLLVHVDHVVNRVFFAGSLFLNIFRIFNLLVGCRETQIRFLECAQLCFRCLWVVLNLLDSAINYIYDRASVTFALLHTA